MYGCDARCTVWAFFWWAHSRRAARWGERILLLGIALAWGVTGLLSPSGNESVWEALFVLLLLGVGALCMRRAWESDWRQ